MPVTTIDYAAAAGASTTTTLDAGAYSLQQMTEGFKIPQYDYIGLTYVASGDGAGEIQTVTYRTGNATGPIVAVLTLGYGPGNNNLTSVTRTDS